MVLVDWPLSRVRVRCGPVELRYPGEDDLAALLTAARSGIHDPAVMPFSYPWTDVPSPAFERNSLQHWWRTRAEWRPEKWSCDFAVVCDGQVVGSQGMMATDFAITREVSSGSWLALAHQGRGIGTLMRAALLHLAFDGLGAQWACSGAFFDNAASRRVSERLGYEADGMEVRARRGEPAALQRFRLSRERWERHRVPERVEVDGLDAAALSMFGAAQ